MVKTCVWQRCKDDSIRPEMAHGVRFLFHNTERWMSEIAERNNS